MGSNSHDQRPDFTGFGPVPYVEAEPSPNSAPAEALAKAQAAFLTIPGVTSVGLGLGPAGGKAIIVGVLDAGVGARLPQELDGMPVVVTTIGEVDALRPR